MLHGGTSSADREPFVEAARFVCSVLGPAPLGVMVVESTGRCISVNATLEALSRQAGEAQRPEGMRVVFSAPELKLALERAVRGEASMVETDAPPVLARGLGLWKLHFLPFAVASERGAAVLYEDTTESRLVENAFQAAEQRFRLLVDSAADGIVIYRAQVLLYVNPEAVRLFGFETPDDLVGRPLIDVVDVEHRSSFELRIADVETKVGAEIFETHFVRRDGKTFPVECRTSHARIDEMGAGFLFFRDIAARKRVQSRRENARRIDALARLAKSFASELNDYVSSLRRLTSRMTANGSGILGIESDFADLVDTMASRAEELTLAREPEVGRSSVAQLEELLERVCNKIVPTNSGEPQPVGTSSPVVTSQALLVDVEPLSCAVRGDSAAIEAGLVVLARAALRARVGNVPLSIRGSRLVGEDGIHGPVYLLSITGGRQKHSTSSSLHAYAAAAASPAGLTFGSWEQGRDLELLGAFALLQSQGCWVEVQPCVGGGLAFEVELPLHPKVDHSDELEENPIPSSEKLESSVGLVEDLGDDTSPDTERSHGTGPLHLERAMAPILICDDESRLVALTAGLLREFGFDVLTVRSGEEAIRAVMSHPIDVVILDVNLPGEDAQEIVADLRTRSHVSVILSSGYTEEDIEPDLLHDSAVKAFLAKPYGVETLVNTIDQVRLRSRGTTTSKSS